MKQTRLLFLAFLMGAFSIVHAQVNVTGTVTEAATAEPIIGASVVEEGTTNGTITDFDGNFTLTVKEGTQLTISYVGYQSQTLPAQNGMKVLLKEDSELLEEVVVTGYTVQRKADLTGSVSVVKADELKTVSSPDPMLNLQGRVAGVTITPSNGADPNGTGTVRIRGIGSFNADQNPLYIIDGVPTTQTLNSLNAADIESMQVLKDAASASIYGSRAANGVIIITTKKGKANQEKIKVDINASLTTQFLTPQHRMKLMNAEQYSTAMVQAALNDGKNAVDYARNYGLDINAADGTPITVWNPQTNSYEDYTVNGAYDGYINARKTMRYSDTDWLDAITRTGFIQNYDASLNYGTEKVTTMFSLGYKRNDGMIKYTNFQSISARLNTQFNINKYVSVGENLTFTMTDYVSSSPMENALKMAPTVPLYEEDGVTFSGPVGGMSDRHNPLREIYQNRNNNTDIMRLFGNAYIDIKPVKGLLIRSNFGIDYDGAYHHYNTYTFHSDIVNNDLAKVDQGQANDMKWNWSNTVQYDLTFGNTTKHNMTFLAGTEMYSQTRKEVSGYGEDYRSEDLSYMYLNTAGGIERAYGIKTGYRLLSFFGKIDYNWNDQILASVTVREDGSSRFGKNNRFATFPAASLGYRISRHLEDQTWLDDLKLRLSWGMTGNQAIDNYARYTLYEANYGNERDTGTAYDFTGTGSGLFSSGYRISQTGNENIRWETATQYNLGIDFAVLRNSLYMTYDLYRKDVTDMLIQPAYIGSRGEGGATWENGPSLSNWGMEMTIGYRKTFDNGLGLDASFNWDFFRNRVTYLPEGTTGSYAHTTKENLVESGRPYGSAVGYVVDGLYQTQEEVLASGQENARLGGLKYKDLDGNGIINADDQTWIYNPVPDFSYGINIGLTYMNFDLTLFFQGVAGVDVINNQKYQTDFWSITDAGSNKGNNMLGAWNTNNTGSSIPRLTTSNTADEGRFSTYYVENGSYLKLRNLQLGWTMPTKWSEKARMSNFRAYISGQNLLTIKSRSLSCSDPENPNWSYPNATSFVVGLQVSFQ